MGCLCGAGFNDVRLRPPCLQGGQFRGGVLFCVAGDPEEAVHSWVVEDVCLCGGVFDAKVASGFEFRFYSFAISDLLLVFGFPFLLAGDFVYFIFAPCDVTVYCVSPGGASGVLCDVVGGEL